jgi:hypothetical protein
LSVRTRSAFSNQQKLIGGGAGRKWEAAAIFKELWLTRLDAYADFPLRHDGGAGIQASGGVDTFSRGCITHLRRDQNSDFIEYTPVLKVAREEHENDNGGIVKAAASNRKRPLFKI